jgi:hypothetical protein
VICVETRHMQAVVKAQINKTDRNDGRGITHDAGWALLCSYRVSLMSRKRNERFRSGQNRKSFRTLSGRVRLRDYLAPLWAGRTREGLI